MEGLKEVKALLDEGVLSGQLNASRARLKARPNASRARLKGSCQVSTQRGSKDRKQVGVDACGQVEACRMRSRSGREWGERHPVRPQSPRLCGNNGVLATRRSAQARSVQGPWSSSRAARCLAASCCKERRRSDACLRPQANACLRARLCPYHSRRVRARETRAAEATPSPSPALPAASL